MKEAVIVSTARTPIGKAYRGGFNNLQAPTMGAHAIRAAVERAGIEGDRVEDCIMGAALTQGTSGMNIGRNASLRAGLPVTVSGMTIDRQCSSGLMAVATAAKQVMHDGMDCVVGGGLDSISLVQNEHMNGHRLVDNELVGMHKDIYMPMLQTAEVVAARYGISRDAMDEYGFESLCTGSKNQHEKKTYICFAPKKILGARPQSAECRKYLKGVCKNGRFQTGLDRFYIPQRHARKLEQAVINKRGEVILSLDGIGGAAITDLLIDGLSWKKWVSGKD